MSSSRGKTTDSGGQKGFSFRGVIQKFRKRHIIETLAAFIGGGWLLVEVVERLLGNHYRVSVRTSLSEKP